MRSTPGSNLNMCNISKGCNNQLNCTFPHPNEQAELSRKVHYRPKKFTSWLEKIKLETKERVEAVVSSRLCPATLLLLLSRPVSKQAATTLRIHHGPRKTGPCLFLTTAWVHTISSFFRWENWASTIKLICSRSHRRWCGSQGIWTLAPMAPKPSSFSHNKLPTQ